MKEYIVNISKSNAHGKKYTAVVGNKEGKTRKIHFGASDYQQYRDSTKLKSYSTKNHLDTKRRKNYFMRHSGVPTKSEAMRKEIKKSNGVYNAKILSHKYLW